MTKNSSHASKFFYSMPDMKRSIAHTFLAILFIAGLAFVQPHSASATEMKPEWKQAEDDAAAATSAKAADKDSETDASDAPFVMPELETIGYAKPWQLGFQQAQSPVMKSLDSLHTGLTILMTLIVIFVMILLAYVCIRFRAKRNPVASKVSHNTLIEIVWTVVPILILIGIAIPTLRIHYGQTYNFEGADMTIKVTGHQWYWSYEYPDDGIAFDSNLKKKEDLKEGEPYLLAVDNPLVVPVGKKINIEMTSADVIHSWALPALGVKRDTVPGKLNQTWFTVEKEGIYYGQCSELCGKFHGFMPIAVYAVSEEDYNAWKKHAKLEFASHRYGTSDFAAK